MHVAATFMHVDVCMHTVAYDRNLSVYRTVCIATKMLGKVSTQLAIRTIKTHELRE